MFHEFALLLSTAFTIGVIHALLGPDHYLPFAAMAKARGWTRAKTIRVTMLCGLGHIGSSVTIGFLGVGLGWALGSVEALEAARAEWAAWCLVTVGLVYGVWGLRRGLRNRTHSHVHTHPDGIVHTHSHGHRQEHAHVHDSAQSTNITPWVLFVAFVLGPCEPLIPLLIVPALSHGWWQLGTVVLVFGVATLATMLACVSVLLWGFSALPFHRLERWSHALAGLAVFACGGAMAWLGL